MKSATLVWNADGVAGDPTGGSGEWNLTSAFWDNAGSIETWDNGGNHTALFGGTAGTVTLGTNITAGGLTFNVSGYTIAPTAAETLTLGGATPSIAVTSVGHTAAITASLAGSAGFTLSGAGTLVLSGANTYSGTTTLSSGVLSISQDANLGTAPGSPVADSIVFNGGTLQITGTLNPTIDANRGITINSGVTGTVQVLSSANTVSYGGLITGAAGTTFKKTGAGALDLQGDSSATMLGALNVDGGTLKLSGGGRLAGVSGVTLSNRGVLTLDNGTTNNADRLSGGAFISNGGTLNFLGNAAATTETIGDVTLNAGALTINSTSGAGGNTLTIPSITRNAGGMLYVSGAGLGGASNSVLLTTAPALTNTILPWAVVSNGTVTRFATHGGNGTSLAPQTTGYQASQANWGAATVNALPTADQTVSATRTIYTLTLDNTIDLLAPAADRTLNVGSGGFGAVLQTGGTSIIGATAGSNEHILAFGTNEAIFHTVGDLTIQRGNTNNLTGSGGLTKSGAGKLIVNANAITGVVRLNEGTYRAVTQTNALGAGTVEFNGGNAELAGEANVSFARNTAVNADATITIDRATTSGAGVTHTLGTLSIGARTLNVQTGSLVTADSVYGLTFGATTFTGSPVFNVANNGTGTGTLTLGAITNAGSALITKIGAGNLVTSGTAPFGGPIDVQGGRIGWSNNTGTTDITESNQIMGAGGIIKSGASTVRLTGTNTYTGPTQLNGGILEATSLSNLGSGSELVFNGGTLRWATGSTFDISSRTVTLTGTGTLNTNGNNVTLANGIGNSGAGGLTKTGDGVLNLQGANTYSGTTTLNAAAGTLVFSGSNSTAGGTTLTTGTIQLNSSSNGGLASGTVTLTAGTLEAINAARAIANNITLTAVTVSGSQDLTFNGTLTGTGTTSRTLTNNIGSGNKLTLGAVNISDNAGTRTLTIAGTGETLISGIIGNGTATTGSFSVTNAGTTTLTGANNYNGTTTLNSATGILQLDGGGVLPTTALTVTAGTLKVLSTGLDQSVALLTMGGGAVGTSSTVEVGTGRILTPTGITYSATNNPLGAVINGGGTLSLGAAGITVTVGNSTSAEPDLTLAPGTLTGSGLLTKAGAGSLWLNPGTNSFTGTIQIDAGSVRDTVTNHVVLNGGVLDGNSTLTRTLDTVAGTNTLAWAANAAGGFAATGGDLSVDLAPAGPLVWNSTTGFVNGTGSIILNSATADSVVTWLDNIDLNDAGGTQTRTFTINDNTAVTTDKAVISGVLSNSTGTISKAGAGTLELSGANTFTGGISVAAGVLQFSTVSNNGGVASNLGQGTDGISLGGGTLSFIGSANQSTNRAITLTAGSTLSANGTGGASITYAGAISTAGSSLTLTGTGAGAITGGITQTGTAADLNVNSGTWTLSGTTLALADDVINTGSTAVLNLNSTGVLGYLAGTSNGLYARSGATINLNANDVNGAANSGGLDFIILGDIGAGMLNTNGFSITTPRLDIGDDDTLIDMGTVTGSGVVTVTSTLTDYTAGIHAYRGSIAANLAGVATFQKLGLSDVTLSGDNSGLTGTVAATRLDAGGLILDYSTNNATKLSTSAALDMRGVTLTLNGGVLAATTQTVPSLTLGAGGASRIVVNSGAFSTTFNLNAITRAAAASDGTMRFVLPASGAITTTSVNVNGILGGWATVDDGTGTYFAQNDGSGNIVPLLSTAKNDVTTWLAGEHITDETTGFTGTLANADINSLRFNAAGPSTVTIGSTGMLSIASGGVFVTSNVTGGAPTITGGMLNSGIGEIIITHDGAQQLAIGSSVFDGASLTKAGAGTLVLSGANDYTGATNIFAGALIASGGNAIGDTSPVTLSDDVNSILQITSNETIGRIAGGNSTFVTGVIDIGGNTLTINNTGGSTTYSGVFTGSGTIIKNGAGTNTNLNLNGASGSGFTGSVIVNGGLLQFSAAGSMDATSIALNKTSLLLLDKNGTTSIGTALPDTIAINMNSVDGASSGNTIPRGLWIRRDQGSTLSETVGVITLNSGANYSALEATATNAITVLNADNIVRANGATLNVRGSNMQNTSGTRAQLRISTAANQTAFIAAMIGGAGAAGTKTVSIVPWAIAENTTAAAVAVTNMGNSLASYVSGQGFRALDFTAEYNTYALAAATENTRESLTTNLTGLAGKTLNALVIHNGSTDASTISVTGTGAGQTLTLTSGALLFTLNTAATASSAHVVNLGGFDGGIQVGATANQYVIHVVNPSAAATTATLAATISSPLNTATASLVKAGLGTLILTGTNTYAGGTFINEGVLEAGSLANLGTAGITFAGGTLRLGSGFPDDPSTRVLTFLSGGATIDTNGISLSFANAIGNTGIGGFTKAGAGTLLLGAAANYSGPTAVAEGTLTMGVNQAISMGDLTVAAGATLDLGTFNASVSNASLGNLTGTGTLTVAGTTTLGQANVSAPLAGAMNLVKTGTDTATVSNTANSFTGFTSVQNGVLSIGVLSDTGVASPLGMPTGLNAVIRLGATTTTGTLQYTGAAASTDRPIWLAGTTGGGTIDNDGSGPLTLNGAIHALQSGAKNLTLQGTAGTTVAPNVVNSLIDGTTGVLKAEAGVWRLNASNAYTGNTTINEGVLQIGTTQNLAGGLLFGSAGTITTTGTLDLSGASATFGGAMTVQTNSATANVVDIGAARSLTINNNATLGSSGANSETVINFTGGGTLNVSNSAAGSFFVVGGAVGTGNKSTADLSGLSALNISLNTTDGIVRVNPNSGTNVADKYSTLILPSTGAGNTMITAATLAVGNSGQNNGGVVNTLKLGTGTNTIHVNTVNIGTGARDGGAIVFNTASGTLVLRDAAGTGRVAFNMGTGTATTGIAATNTFDVTGHNANLLLGDVSIGTQLGRTSALTSTFSFDTGILDMTSLTMSSKGSAGSTVTTSTFNIGGGTVNSGTITMATTTTATAMAIANLNITGGTVTLSGNIVKGGGPGTDTANVTLGGTASLDLAGNAIGDATNAITFEAQAGTLKNVSEINGGGTWIKTTSGTLLIDGLNSYTGALNAQDGFVVINGGVDNRLSASSSFILGSGATSGVIQLGNASGKSDQTVSALSTSGSGTGNAIVNGNAAFSTLTVNQASNTTFAGSLGGAGSNENNLHLIKSGAGALTLTGSSSYTGATTINGGSLYVDATSGGLGATSGITLADGTRLGLRGTTNSVDVVYGFSGTGNKLTVGGTTGATLGFGIDGLFNSQIALLTGQTMTVNGTLTTEIYVNSVPTAGHDYILINGADPNSMGLTGTFDLNPVVFNGGSFTYMLRRETLSGTVDRWILTPQAQPAEPDVWWKGDLGGVATGVWSATTTSGTEAPSNWDKAQSSGEDAVVPPDSGSVVHFSATGAANFATTLGANLTIKKLVFESGSITNGVSIGGADTLTIGSGSVSGSGGLDVATGNGTGTISITAPVMLGVAQSWNVADTGSILSFSGGIGGTGPLAINDNGTASGTVVIGGASATYTGTTSLGAGRLILNGADRLPVGTALTLGSATTSAVLQLGNGNGASNTSIGSFDTGAATGNAIVGGDAAVSTLTIVQTANGTFNGAIGGAGTNENNVALTKQGTATLTLNGANTYTGGTTINAGTLMLGAAGSLTGGTLSVSADAGATATLDINGRTVVLTGATTLGGGDATAMAQIIDSSAVKGTLTLGGNVTFNATNNPLGATISANLLTEVTARAFTANDSTSAATDLTVSGNYTANTVGTNGTGITLNGTGAGLWSGTINLGAASGDNSASDVTKNGTGTWTLTNTVTFRDDVNVTAGTLIVNPGGQLGTSTAQGDDLVISGASTIVELNTANAFRGDDAFVRTGAMLRIGATNALQRETAGGNVNGFDDLLIDDSNANTTGGSTLDLQGFGAQFDTLTLGVQAVDAAQTILAGNIINTGGTRTNTLAASSAGDFNLRGGTISANLAGGDLVNKTTRGTVTLSGNNTMGGTTTLADGTLVLDFAPSGSDTERRIGTGNLTLGSTAANSSQAMLSMLGGPTFAAAQSVTNLVSVGGSSQIALTSNGQTTTLTITGTLSRTGGTVDFTLPALGSVAYTGATANSNGIIGGWATVGMSDFATINAGSIVALAAYAAKNDVTMWTPADNVTNTGAFTGVVGDCNTINSLRFGAAAASTVTVSEALIVASGGIMVTSNVGANASAITGGTLVSGIGDLIVHQHNTGGALTIGSALFNGTNVTKAGSGTLVLTGSNSTGTVNVNEGVLRVSGGSAISDTSAVSIYNVAGATLELAASQSETIGTLAGGGVAGGSVILNTGSSLTITETTATAFSGQISGAGALVKVGTAVLTLDGLSTAFTGPLTVGQGQVLVNGANGRLGSTAVTLNTGEILIDQDQGAAVDRIANGATITLNNTAGGNGLFLRTNQGATRTETITGVTLAAGHNVITAHGTVASAVADLSGTTLTRTAANHATALVRGNNLGASSGQRGQIRFSTAPAGSVGGGGAAGTTNISILPYLVGELSQTGIGNTLVTNTGGTNGLRPLASTEYVADEAGFNGLTGATTNNVRFATDPAGALTGTATAINALVLDAATGLTITGPASAFEITSGAIVAANTGNHTLGGFTGLTTAGTRDYIVYVTNSAANFTIDSALTTNNVPLVKSGAGTLTLTNTSNAFNATYLNQGAVQIAGMDRLGTGTITFFGGGLRWATGATFDPFVGRTLTVNTGGGFFDTNGNDVTLASGLDLGGAATTSFAKLGDGTLTINAASSYTGSFIVGHTASVTAAATPTVVLNGTTNAAIAGPLFIGHPTATIPDTNVKAIVALGANEQIANTASITFRGTAGEEAYLRLEGFTETIASISDVSGNGLIENVTAEEAATDGTLILNSSQNFGFNGILRDRGSLSTSTTVMNLMKQGTGTQTLSGSSITYTGATTISGGALRLVDATAFASAIANNSTLILDRSSGTWNLGVAISGTGVLQKFGVGTVTLSGTNSYSGQTLIQQGVLSIGASENLGDGSATNTIELANGATLQSTGATVDLGANRSVALVGALANIDVTGANTLTLSGVVSGPDCTVFTKTGAGALVLTGSNSYLGATSIAAGTLQIGSGSTTGTLGAGAVVNSGTLRFNRSDAYTLINAVSGTGTLAQAGAGTLNLPGSYTYTGATMITAGTVNLTGTLGATAVTVNGGGTLTGTGTVGTTTGGTVIVAGGATPATQGAINLVNGSFGTLTLQSASGTTALTIGTGGDKAILAFEIGAPGSSDRITIGNNALVDATGGGATVNITALAGLGTGTYDLITFGAGGQSGFSNLALGTLPGGGALSYALSETSTAWQLAVTNAAAGATAYWRGDLSAVWNTVSGDFFTNWYADAAGTTNTQVPGANTDVFFTTDNASGNFSTTLGADTSIKSLTFTGTGTPAAGNSVEIGGANVLTLGSGGVTVQTGSAAHTISAPVTLGADQTWTNNSASALTVSSEVGGAFGVTKSGSGALVLSNGSSTFTGGVTVSAGTLVIGTSSTGAITMSSGSGPVGRGTLAIGSGITILGTTAAPLGGWSLANAVTISGNFTFGGVDALESLTLSGPVALSGVGHEITVSDADVVATLSGAITDSGSGEITKSGDGTLVLSNTGNNYGGSTTVNGGVLQLGASEVIPNNSAVMINSGGILEMLGNSETIGSLAGGGQVQSTGGAPTITVNDGAGSDTEFSGKITNAVKLVKTGAGKLTLSGANSDFTGGVTINGGTLVIGANSSPVLTPVSGSGPLGRGTLTLGDGITIQGKPGGSWTIANAVVIEGDITFGGTTADENLILTGTVDLGAVTRTLTVNSAVTTTLSGVVSGAGGLTKAGPGTLVLGGANTFGGDTTVSAGAVRLGAGDALPDGAGKGNVTVNATLDLNGNSDTINALSGSGTIDNAAASTASTLTIGNTDATSTFAGTIQNSGSGATLALVKVGTGTLALSGMSTYAGGTTISAGTLAISADANLGDAAGTLTFSGASTLAVSETLSSSRPVVLDATATVSVADTKIATVSGKISGTAGLVKDGTGTLALTNPNTTAPDRNSYAGGTTINAGTLSVSLNEQLGDDSSAITFGGAATLQTTGAAFSSPRTLALPAGAVGTIEVAGSTATLSGTISGATGTLRKAGAGELVVSNSGDNTYGGGTSIAAGTLSIAKESHLGTGSVTFSGASTLKTSGDFTTSRSFTLNAAGTFEVASGTTLTLGSASELHGASGMSKAGAGTLVVASDNSSRFTGPTTIDAGTYLAANTSGSAAGDGNVTVNAGGTFGGTGSVTGSVSVDGGTVAPGMSIGTLSTGALSFLEGSTFSIELKTSDLTSDRVNITGDLSLSGAVTLALSELGADTALNVGDRISLASYSGTWNGGKFTVAGFEISDWVDNTNPSAFSYGSNIFGIDYNFDADLGSATNPLEITLVVVPEPGSFAALAASTGLLLGLRRFRRRESCD